MSLHLMRCSRGELHIFHGSVGVEAACGLRPRKTRPEEATCLDLRSAQHIFDTTSHPCAKCADHIDREVYLSTLRQKEDIA